MDIANQVKNPQSDPNWEFDHITERDDEFSDISLLTDDYFNKKL